MKHDWYGASGGGLIANLWTLNPLTIALLEDTYVPNRDTHRVWGDISTHEVAGPGYSAGGQLLAGRITAYDPSNDRTDLLCDDASWGPGATFDTRYAVLYDNSGTKPIWSLIDYEGLKSVANGVFTVDFASIGALYVRAVPSV